MIWISRCFMSRSRHGLELIQEHFLYGPFRFINPHTVTHRINQSVLRRSCLLKLRPVFQNRGYVSKCRDISFSQQHYIQGSSLPQYTEHTQTCVTFKMSYTFTVHGANVTLFAVVRKVSPFLLRLPCYSPSRNRCFWGIYCAEFRSEADGKLRKC